MLNAVVFSVILLPVLIYRLVRRPRPRSDVLRDYIIPAGVEVRPCVTHWGVPVGRSQLNRALLNEITCHPDYADRSVPVCWFQWSPADARRRARTRRAMAEVAGVLPIRKQA
ncbi:MAG: hypothetical protein ACREL5_14885 [Gemmatimonadales bacterium]